MNKTSKEFPQLSEHQIQQQCISYLRAKGFYVQRMNAGAIRTDKGHMVRMSQVGTPDILFIKDGRANFIEVKKPRGKVTFLQKQKMKELEEYGAKCFVIHSLEELQTIV